MPIILARIQWSFNNWRGWDQQIYDAIKNEGKKELASYPYVEESGFGVEFWNFYEGFDPNYYYGSVVEKGKIHLKEAEGKINLVFFVSYRKTAKTSLAEDTYLIGFYGYAEVIRGQTLIEVLTNALSEAKELPKEILEELANATQYLNLRSKKKYSALLPIKLKFNWQRYGLSPKTLSQATFRYISKEQAKKILEDIRKSQVLCSCYDKELEVVIDPTILTKVDLVEEELEKGTYD